MHHHPRQDSVTIPGMVSQDRHFQVITSHFSFLGFQKEADSLLSVTKLSTMSDSKNTRKAREILLKLAEETSIFPASWELSERYLLIVVSACLISPVFGFHLFCYFLGHPSQPPIPASPSPPGHSATCCHHCVHLWPMAPEPPERP